MYVHIIPVCRPYFTKYSQLLRRRATQIRHRIQKSKKTRGHRTEKSKNSATVQYCRVLYCLYKTKTFTTLTANFWCDRRMPIITSKAIRCSTYSNCSGHSVPSYSMIQHFRPETAYSTVNNCYVARKNCTRERESFKAPLSGPVYTNTCNILSIISHEATLLWLEWLASRKKKDWSLVIFYCIVLANHKES